MMSLIISSLTVFFFTGGVERWTGLPSKSNEIMANTNFQLRVGLENLRFCGFSESSVLAPYLAFLYWNTPG